MIYLYDGHSSWHLGQSFPSGRFERNFSNLIAISGDTLAVVSDIDQPQLCLYRNVRGVWSKTESLSFTNKYAGVDFAMEGDHLVVSGRNEFKTQAVLLTYKFNHENQTWLKTGTFFPPGELSTLTIKDKVLVVTVNHYETDKEICGVVYRLSSNNEWKESVILKTIGQPVEDRWIFNFQVSTQNGFVYTSRVTVMRSYDSMIFVHNITKVFLDVDT